MKNLISFFAVIFCLSILPANAADSIDKVVRHSGIHKAAVSVSIKDIKTGKKLYSLNENKPVNPASTQKLLTSAVALEELGADYNFKTSLFKSANNDLYLKLSGDPFLTSKDLKSLLETAKNKKIIEPKHFYIDDYVLDSVTWGEGWQWDDDLNPLMPKFGAYNLDGNLIKVIVAPTKNGAPANVYTEVFYPWTFMNLAVTGKENCINISRNTTISPDMLQVEGTVSKLEGQSVPVNNMKRYFRLRLEDAINESKILYYGKIEEKSLPKDKVYFVASVEHPLTEVLKSVLQDSNNMMAETLFKVAGGNFVKNTGSIKSALEMLQNYCSANSLNCSGIKLVDGSGVSKNNLMTADFMTSFLIKEYKSKNFEVFKSAMAVPGEGTLSNRMLYFGENLQAKTGTLTDVSAIAGYIKTRRGHECVFDIMINDSKSKASDKKMLEEYILRSVYANY